MINSFKHVTISSLSSSPLHPIQAEVDPSLQQIFDMQVKGEAIEEHINDKEVAYQRSILVLYIVNRGCISEVYIRSITVLYINNRGSIS